MNGFAELAQAAAAAKAVRPDVALALATLVDVEGSSYRQPGARLLVDTEGRVLAGAVSGGCLEADVAARAGDVWATGRATKLTYDLRTDLETIWGFGAMCDGVAHIQLQPLHDGAWLESAELIRSSRHGGAMVTLVRIDGSGGASVLVDGNAESGHAPTIRHIGDGTLSGDEEQAIADLVRSADRTGLPFAHELPSGMGTAFVEPLLAPIALHIVGAGRGAELFARIASTMGWTVSVLDHRPALLESLTLPAGVTRRGVSAVDGPRGALESLPHDSRTAVALLTHIFDVDVAWLKAALPLPLSYVGVLGSRTRGSQLMERAESELQESGLEPTARMRRKLHAPIGLDLGGEDPASIALAAIAEIEAVMHARPGGFLRERQSPIHTRSPSPRLLNQHSAPEKQEPA
ncbi:MAG TPA: XdhC family protein [Gemmatimonas sp.]|uniref:XdhC family protein n=1 Tax=Gemmatimonas sp. TaxID=1962908 RepID=UPI002EDB6B81